MARGKGDGGGTIVIKKIEEGGHGHHGGAWKVAYADFVTAMMAFFLLMWLLNATSEEQRRGIADFFAPTNVLGQAVSGSGQPFSGRTLNSTANLVSDSGVVRVERGAVPVRLDIDEEEETPDGVAPNPGQGQGNIPGPGQPAAAAETPAEEADASGPGGEAPRSAGAARLAAATDRAAAQRPDATEPVAPEELSDEEVRAEHERRERASLERAAEEIRAAVRDDPALAALARQLVVEVVPEGLRIQLLDAERQPMFASGSAAPNERARALLQKVAQIAGALPNALSISGHTDATPFRGGGERSNWELSAERANAVRRLLLDAGIAEDRMQGVTGHAERMPLLPDQPTAAANRRVAITLMRTPPPPPRPLPEASPAPPSPPAQAAATQGRPPAPRAAPAPGGVR
jgi:chemotaxis protein MotB